MIRGYDTNALWRHDEIIRIRHLEVEITDMQKRFDRQKQKAVAREVRLQKLMKEMGITDQWNLVRLRRTRTCFALLTYALEKTIWIFS